MSSFFKEGSNDSSLFKDKLLAFFREGSAFGRNHPHQFIPGLDERRRRVRLEFVGQGVDIDPRRGELRQHLFAVSAVRSHERRDISVVCERLQRALGHRVHRERGRQRLDVQNVGGQRILWCLCSPTASAEAAITT